MNGRSRDTRQDDAGDVGAGEVGARGHAAADVVTLGETLVSFRGELASGSALVARVAGAESNVAVGIARLGHRVRWVSRLGDDPFGHLVARELRAEGVDVVAPMDSGRPTGVMFALSAPLGRRRVQYRRAGSAASAMGPDAVDAVFAGGPPRLLHLTGITPALSASCADAVRAAADEARRRDVPVSLDINFRAALWNADDASRALAPLAASATIVIGSPEELELVAPGVSGIEATAAALLGVGVTEVVVKLGAGGARCFTGNGEVTRPALPVGVVDPIGAGDAFCAGYLSARLDGLGVGERLERGNLLGACAVASATDWEGLPTRADLATLTGPDVLR